MTLETTTLALAHGSFVYTVSRFSSVKFMSFPLIFIDSHLLDPKGHIFHHLIFITSTKPFLPDDFKLYTTVVTFQGFSLLTIVCFLIKEIRG